MGIIELSDKFFGLTKNKLQKRLQSRFDKISFKASSLTPAALAAALSACNDNQPCSNANSFASTGTNYPANRPPICAKSPCAMPSPYP